MVVETDHQVIGKIGRLVGAIEPGRMGEVMFSGLRAHHGPEGDAAEAIPTGTRVVVIEHEPPRTVIVSRIA